LDAAARVGHAEAMSRTVTGTATAPGSLDARRYDAVGTLLTQRRVVDYGLVTSTCCR
jgi:hypothetical protein